MNIATVLLCMGITLIGAGIFFLTRLLNTGRQKNPAATPAPEKQTPRKSRLIWLLYLSIALSVAYWMIWGALFFLIVVWLLRLDAGAEASTKVGDNEKKTARRVYTWLFWSSLITVPIFVIQLYYISSTSSTIDDQVLTALIPSLLHIPLLLGLTSKSRFVFRHTQQGILLIALRVGVASLAAMNLDNHLDYAVLLFIFGNGLLWLIGSMVGWSQSSDGTCWLMERKGERIVLQKTQPIKKTIQPAQETDKKLEQFLGSMNTKEKQIAKEKALEAFQSGIQGEVRKNALNILSILAVCRRAKTVKTAKELID